MSSKRRILQTRYLIEREGPANYIEGELDFCHNEFSYETYDVDIRKLSHCLVNFEGVIYNSFLQLVNSSLVGPKLRPQYSIRRLVNELRKLDIITLDNKRRYIIAFDAWSGNHYHWTTEVLSRLFLLKDEIHKYVLILPENDYIKTTGKELLDLLELRPKDIIYIKPSEIIYSESLHFINHVALTGYINDEILWEIKKAIDNKIQHNSNLHFEKVYVSRESAIYRKVLNEPEVVSLMTSRGYKVISFDGISLKDQIDLCSHARIMVSMHGAGLTNMVFMPSGSKILEFRRNKIYHNQCYWHLADALKHKYFYLFGDPDSDLQIEGNGCNLSIPLKKLELELDKLEAF
jgi:capsular polysaccharide biosynthesis protein